MQVKTHNNKVNFKHIKVKDKIMFLRKISRMQNLKRNYFISLQNFSM